MKYHCSKGESEVKGETIPETLENLQIFVMTLLHQLENVTCFMNKINKYVHKYVDDNVVIKKM